MNIFHTSTHVTDMCVIGTLETSKTCYKPKMFPPIYFIWYKTTRRICPMNLGKS